MWFVQVIRQFHVICVICTGFTTIPMLDVGPRAKQHQRFRARNPFLYQKTHRRRITRDTAPTPPRTQSLSLPKNAPGHDNCHAVRFYGAFQKLYPFSNDRRDTLFSLGCFKNPRLRDGALFVRQPPLLIEKSLHLVQGTRIIGIVVKLVQITRITWNCRITYTNHMNHVSS